MKGDRTVSTLFSAQSYDERNTMLVVVEEQKEGRSDELRKSVYGTSAFNADTSIR